MASEKGTYRISLGPFFFCPRLDVIYVFRYFSVKAISTSRVKIQKPLFSSNMNNVFPCNINNFFAYLFNGFLMCINPY